MSLFSIEHMANHDTTVFKGYKLLMHILKEISRKTSLQVRICDKAI